MGAMFNRGVSAAGVTAYQDDAEPTQFHYVPNRTECILGETMIGFHTTYWGISGPIQVNNKSVVGAIVSGQGVLDITEEQRQKILNQIRIAFGVTNPKLKAMSLRNPKATPVIAANTLKLNDGGDLQLPQAINIGQSFNFVIGTGNELFARYVGTQSLSEGVQPNPDIGVNIVGEAEFVGIRGASRWKPICHRFTATYVKISALVSTSAGSRSRSWITRASSRT